MPESLRGVLEHALMQGCRNTRICPFFQCNDQRCSQRFNLRCLHQVFEQCLGDYAACGIFQERSADYQGPEFRPGVCVATS
jgi:hypothetical protein